jgi:hypothetical protein
MNKNITIIYTANPIWELRTNREHTINQGYKYNIKQLKQYTDNKGNTIVSINKENILINKNNIIATIV